MERDEVGDEREGARTEGVKREMEKRKVVGWDRAVMERKQVMAKDTEG